MIICIYIHIYIYISPFHRKCFMFFLPCIQIYYGYRYQTQFQQAMLLSLHLLTAINKLLLAESLWIQRRFFWIQESDWNLLTTNWRSFSQFVVIYE